MVSKNRVAYLIYINSNSWLKFKSLIESFIIPHFMCKLKLRISRKYKNKVKFISGLNRSYKDIKTVKFNIICLL